MDFLLVGISFYCAYYYHRRSLSLDKTYLNLLFSYYGFWILIVWIERKFQKLAAARWADVIWLSGRTSLYLLFLISFLTVLMQLSDLSRRLVLFSCLLLFILESLLFGFMAMFRRALLFGKKEKDSEIKHRRFSFHRLLLDALLLFLSFVIINLVRRHSLAFSDDYLLIAYTITGLWFVFSIFTSKFRKNAYTKNIWYFLSPYIKTLLMMMFGLALFVFTMRYYYFSRFELFGTLLIFSIAEISVFTLIYIIKKVNTSERDIESIDDLRKISCQKPLALKDPKKDTKLGRNLLERGYLVDYPELYEFVQANIGIDFILESELTVLNTRSSYNIMHLKLNSVSLFINMRQINDFRWINRYLIRLHQRVTDGGYIVGNLETIHQHKVRFYRKMPAYLAQILYIPDFLFRRVFPKLPIFKKIYFFFSDGKNRALSKAEAFGRLQFCGFSVIAEREINNHLYFIARKVKTISVDKNPSYSPLIKLPRIGLNGDTINIYKFRTMYPYSEYLQEYVYQHNQLNKKGKLKNDFRLTGWGKVFRKMWIDELPQIINWWRGEVSLVGVRALSQHFFDLYPKDIQLLRIRHKPGLVPPYYADMPKIFSEILESEQRYLQRKEEKPFITDVIYFYKAFYNIFFHHARSG